MTIIPDHLPKRLAICYWGWDWIISALADEPYGNLERAMAETKERGFNCIRLEVGPNWMYMPDGRQRGEIEFQSFIKGGVVNAHCIDGKGGGKHDVLKRVILLFELAKKYNIYVIPTSWEYQDSTTNIADKKIRDEVFQIPPEKRLMHISIHHNRLINELKMRGLDKQIAFFEIHNEIDISDFPTGSKNKEITEEAIEYLRGNHNDILITADYAFFKNKDIFANNAQVIDHHVYSIGLMDEVFKRAGIGTDEKWFDIKNNEFLQWLFKDNPTDWNEFCVRAESVKDVFKPTLYLYENIDNERYDYWCFAHYGEFGDVMIKNIEERLKEAADFAKSVNLPIVVDEGYYLYPPLGSRFEQSAAGRWINTKAVESAIANDYWGILFSCYTRPNTYSWTDKYHCKIMKEVNLKIINS